MFVRIFDFNAVNLEHKSLPLLFSQFTPPSRRCPDAGFVRSDRYHLLQQKVLGPAGLESGVLPPEFQHRPRHQTRPIFRER